MAYHSGGNHDPYGPDAHAPSAAGPPERAGGSGGVPDGLLIGGLALALSMTLLVWTSTGIAGRLAHGAWPDGVSFDATAGAIRSFLTAPGDIPAAWPAGDPETLPSAAMVWTAFFGQLLLAFATLLGAAIRIGRWRQRRAEARYAAAARSRADEPAEHHRPSHRGVFAPPRDDTRYRPEAPAGRGPAADAGPATTMGAGGGSVDRPTPVTAVLKAPGGTVVVDPDGTLYQRTARQRGRLGPVHVYDPGEVGEATVRLRWAPHRGCERLDVARPRAVALLAPVRPREPVLQLDAETAETLLRGYLHAAALDGTAFSQVQRWNRDHFAEPAKILRSHAKAAPGLSMEFDAALSTHPGRRDAAAALVDRTLEGLDQPAVRQSCAPGRVDLTAVDTLAEQQGTLYIVGGAPATAPFRGALLDAVAGDLHVVRG